MQFNVLARGSVKQLIPAFVVMATLCLTPAPLAAQSVEAIATPAGWTKTKGDAEMSSFTTAFGTVMATYATAAPEVVARGLLEVSGTPTNDINVQSNGDMAMGILKLANGRTGVSIAQRGGPNGKTAVLLLVIATTDNDRIMRAVEEGVALLGLMVEPAMAATPEPKKVVSPAPVSKIPPALVGLWLGIDSGYSIDYTGSGSWGTTVGGYAFTPGGYFVQDVPEGGFGDADALRAIAKDPDMGGSVAIKPDVIELHYASGKVDTLEYKKAAGGWTIPYGTGYLNKKIIAPNGYRLNGTWHNQRLTNSGAGWINGSTYIHFTQDGHFFYSNSVSLSNAALTSIQRDPASGGTYSVADGAITLSYADGRRETMSLFWETSPKAAMWLDNAMYKPAE